jgi:hypothetical protein
MYSLITKPAVLLSILILLPLASSSADLKRVPLILMDTGKFVFPFEGSPSADLEGDGTSTHLGKIVSTGVFESLGPGPPGRFKGKIEGEAMAVDLSQMATATSGETATATSGETATVTSGETATATSGETATATSGKPDTIKYRLSAEFRPDASGIFYGIGTFVITGGTGKFKRAKGFGEFIGLADLPPGSQSYNCFLRGVISY